MSTLYVDNLEPNLGSRVMAAGHVVQGVQGTGQNAVLVTTSQTFVASGVKVLITPTSASSKIHLSGWLHVYKSVGIHYQCALHRNGVNLMGAFGNGGSDNDAGTAHYDAPISWVDSPNTTSEVTYELYLKGRETCSFTVNDGGNYTSNLVAMEIAQ